MKIIVLVEKYHTYYLDASTPELKERHCYDIISKRLEEGWYFGDAKEAAQQAIKNKSLKNMQRFLESRSDCEYEQFSVEPLESYK